MSRPVAWRSTTFVVVAVTTLAGACSREVEPFAATDRDENIGASPQQLTFSSQNDRTPTWTSNADSIVYNTEGGGHLPPDLGVLVALPIEGGAALPVLRNGQLEGDGIQNWLVTPAVSPDGERLAFVDIVSLWDAHPCELGLTVLSCGPPATEEAVRRPELKQVALHVRRFDATDPLASDQVLAVTVPGATQEIVDGPIGPLKLTVVNNYPFQQLFRSERAYAIRMSWSPSGDRLAISDGLSIQIWTPGTDNPEVLPGTTDGSWPAWSPIGDWIAFTRLERADSSGVSCDYLGGFGPACRQLRTDYIPGRHVLHVVRPDGSELRELGVGDEPAWAPDGNTIYFRRDNQIWRSDPDGSGATPVMDTVDGREPAVSPDGTKLAFARLNSQGIYDIWVIGLAP